MLSTLDYRETLSSDGAEPYYRSDILPISGSPASKLWAWYWK